MQTFEAQLTAATIPTGRVVLEGQLRVPVRAQGLVVFAHGSGSSRHSPRHQRVADYLHEAGMATLLFDLLAPEEKGAHEVNRRVRCDVEVLASRLRSATQWARQQPETAEMMCGYYGAGTGAAAALLAAAVDNSGIAAVVTRGARTDLAIGAVARLTAPTMLIVGGNDSAVVASNLEAWAQLACEKSIQIIPGAGHRFEEPGALDNLASLATRWFGDHLRRDTLA